MVKGKRTQTALGLEVSASPRAVLNVMKALFYEGNLADYYPGHVLGEIYKDKVYAPYLAGKSGLTILDVGGNAGWTTNYFSDYAKEIYTVEPSAEHVAVINELIKYNGLKNVTVIQAAVSNKPGKMLLNHNTNKTMFSLSKEVADPTLKGEEVEVTTLENILNQYKIDHVDLLKLDPEGEEGKILCSDSFRRIADKFDTIIFEYHVWCGYNIDQIRTTMKDLGFDWAQMSTEASVFVCQKVK